MSWFLIQKEGRGAHFENSADTEGKEPTLRKAKDLGGVKSTVK